MELEVEVFCFAAHAGLGEGTQMGGPLSNLTVVRQNHASDVKCCIIEQLAIEIFCLQCRVRMNILVTASHIVSTTLVRAWHE